MVSDSLFDSAVAWVGIGMLQGRSLISANLRQDSICDRRATHPGGNRHPSLEFLASRKEEFRNSSIESAESVSSSATTTTNMLS